MHPDSAARAFREAAQALTTLAAEKAQIVEWQPISMVPKREDQFVLLFVPSGLDQPNTVTMGAYYREDVRDDRGRFKGGEWTGVDWDGLPTGYLQPTHWMPLPAPPKQNGGA